MSADEREPRDHSGANATPAPLQPVPVAAVFSAFLKLGIGSFGGPIAHLGYFRREFVERRGWVSESQFAQLLAICQFLPGPASSQLGFSIGLLRAGWRGALAAFVGFTLPSALLMFAFASWTPEASGRVGPAALHGLKLVALAVVAQGVVAMARRLCPDVPRAAIALLAAVIASFSGAAGTQLAVVALGAIAGWALPHQASSAAGDRLRVGYGVAQSAAMLALFALLLAGLPALAKWQGGLAAVAAAFYRSGALVFGGGHVVLPLLNQAVVGRGWMSAGDFLAGYGAAQAVPGPLFTLAAYMGARLPGDMGGAAGAAVALLAIFLPGLLLVAATLPFWHSIASKGIASRSIAGVNAAVVGLLGAALYNPIGTSSVHSAADLAIALVGFGLLVAWEIPALIVVAWCVIASIAMALLL